MRQIHYSAWLLVGLSSLLQILIFPLPGLYVLSWVAFAPLIVALLRARPAGALEIDGSVHLQAATPGQAFLLAYISGILWYAGTCYWIYNTMHEHGGLSVPAAALALFLFCLYLGLYHGLFGLLLGLVAGPRRDNRLALVSVPFLWVAAELARTRVTGFPWDLLGTAQVDNISLSRISTWTGVYGISFEIMLVNVAVAAAFLVPRKRRSTLLAASLAAAAVLQAGRLVDAPAIPADRAALLVQENIPVDENWTRDTFERTLRELTDLSVKADTSSSSSSRAIESAHGKADLIVWPESPAPFFANDPLFREPVSQMAREAHSWIVTGAIGSTPAKQSRLPAAEVFNSAALVSPAGDWTARYDKVHLVPFGEYLPFPRLFAFAGGLTKEVGEFKAGESRTPLEAGSERLGIFICYESVFPDEVRQFADNGAQVFVNISNDGWYGDSGAYAQHLNQTRMRAIENDRWILSATDTGVTASIDPYGRTVARLPRKERGVLVAPYALTSVTTFYTRHGDWFAYLCAIISAAALLMRFILRMQSGKKAETSS
ncbi:MAG TPA: apolipoprotein N-acyltransferase [Candidatus Deferrimicrobiaceae bacterium]|nr:apolipoprotein N-acyltransferase [Candidatus Deferrimicrobiaceae bacterium]